MNDTAFDDNGDLIPVFHPPDPPPGIVLLDALTEATGIHIPRTAAVLEEIEKALDRAGDERGAEALGVIIRHLGENSAAALELKRIIAKWMTEPLRNRLSPKSKVERWLKRKFGKGA